LPNTAAALKVESRVGAYQAHQVKKEEKEPSPIQIEKCQCQQSASYKRANYDRSFGADKLSKRAEK
jgi:hypothetical protein